MHVLFLNGFMLRPTNQLPETHQYSNKVGFIQLAAAGNMHSRRTVFVTGSWEGLRITSGLVHEMILRKQGPVLAWMLSRSWSGSVLFIRRLV